MKVAIQGLDTSFHALAAKRLFGDEATLLYCASFSKAFVALQNKEVDHAVVAVENSLYGSINEVYDLLLKYHFWITGEVYEQISLHLLGLPHTSLATITDVYSQAPALAEAESFLDTNLPGAQRHEHGDTALAAEEVAQWKNPEKAAIASRAAAEKYGLSILAENIETHHHNYTRFIALSRKQTREAGNKSSLTFRTNDMPGSLYAALGVFAKRGINLTKLESRPIVGHAWQYMYYVDIASPIEENLLQELARYAQNIRVLGTYTAGAFESIT